MDHPRFAAAIWEKLGITEHLGGIDTTRHLLDLCGVKPGQSVLDIGCGTGYTACLLAQEYGVRVVALDISDRVLECARERIQERNLSKWVTTVKGDIHALVFPDEAFDVVIAESVLLFCDKARTAAEVYRVLKHGGVFGNNEFAYRKLPPPEWGAMLSAAYFGLSFQPLLREEWLEVFEEVGFVSLSATISPLNLRKQFVSHIRVDGWHKYISALFQGMAMPGVRATFFNRNMLQAWREYPIYVGYGLFVSQKP